MNLSSYRITIVLATLSLIACESVAPEPTWNNPVDPHANLGSSSLSSSSQETPLSSDDLSSSTASSSSQVESSSTASSSSQAVSSSSLSSSSSARVIPPGNLWDYSNPIDSLPDGYTIAGHDADGYFFTYKDGSSIVAPLPESMTPMSTWTQLEDCSGTVCITGTLGLGDEYTTPYFALSYQLFNPEKDLNPILDQSICLAYSSTHSIDFQLRPSSSMDITTRNDRYYRRLVPSPSCTKVQFAINTLNQYDWGTPVTIENYLAEIISFDFFQSRSGTGVESTFKLYSMGIGTESCLCP